MSNIRGGIWVHLQMKCAKIGYKRQFGACSLFIALSLLLPGAYWHDQPIAYWHDQPSAYWHVQPSAYWHDQPSVYLMCRYLHQSLPS